MQLLRYHTRRAFGLASQFKPSPPCQQGDHSLFPLPPSPPIPSGHPNGNALLSPAFRFGTSILWKFLKCSMRWSFLVKPLFPTREQCGIVQGNSGDPMPCTVAWCRCRSAKRVKWADDVQWATSQVHVLEAVGEFAWAMSIAEGMPAGSGRGTYFIRLLLLLQVSGCLLDELAHVVWSWVLTLLGSGCGFGSWAALGFEVAHRESIASATELQGPRSREIHRSWADSCSGVS